jgi:SAM-dependent methyltransferase
MLLQWPAPERNKVPILEVLQRVLPPGGGTLLEVASGSGQHAAFLAAALTSWTWQPSDVDPRNLASIAAHREQVGLPNLLAPRHLDVRQTDWELGPLDAVFNANMIHISPWECCEGLLGGSARIVRRGGLLVLYGPYRVGGEHTAESNRRFDADLRAQDERWGVRDLEAVTELANAHGLDLRERVAMPANNQCLVFVRR